MESERDSALKGRVFQDNYLVAESQVPAKFPLNTQALRPGFDEIDHLFAQKLSSCPLEQELLAKLLRNAREGSLSLSLLPGEEKALSSCNGTSVVLEKGRLYLKRHYDLKNSFFFHLERICKASLQKEVLEIDCTGLEERQQEALIASSRFPFWIITGGPGTGKSYTAARLVKEFSKYIKVVVTAPTGKAAARMRSLLPGEEFASMTLHQLLKMGSLTRVEFLDYDLILVDESSMVDVELFTHLVSCIKEGARLILVGDHEQLPPVEGASYFRQLVEERQENVTFLKRSLRTKNSDLLQLAEEARMGKSLPMKPLPRPFELVDLFLEKILFEKTSFKILTPLKRGPYGSDALNERFFERQKAIYPKSPIPIMITINDESLRVYNGDLAFLHEDKLLVLEDGREISLYAVGGYTHAYAITVHKSQGSEYDEVVLLMPSGSERFGPQLAYTALTRAKHKVTIYG